MLNCTSNRSIYYLTTFIYVLYHGVNKLCFSCDGSNVVETLIKDDVGTGTTLNGSMCLLKLTIDNFEVYKSSIYCFTYV